VAPTAVRLSAHGVLRTKDVDDARASVAASLAPHRLTLLGDVTQFSALHNAAPIGRVSLHYIDYGAEVEVAVDGMDFQLVQIPLAGVTTIRTAGRNLVVTPRCAAVTQIGESLRMHYPAGNPRLMVRVAASLLRDRVEVARQCGVSVAPGSPGVAGVLDLSQGPGRTWRGLLDVALADIEAGNGLSSAPLVAQALEVALVDGLVASLAEEATSSAPAPYERVIRRAARLVDDHCDEPIGTADIAEAVGVSVRALRTGFREHYGLSPMEYLRQARLRRVRGDLEGGRAESVTQAALNCGVTHLGRLSADYQAAFGETPSQTLRRAQIEGPR